MTAPPPRAWKPDLYVVARFLDKLWQPDASYSRSELQRAVRLNYDLFVKYLAFLEARGLVSVTKDAREKDVVRITNAGLAAHRELVEWLRNVLGDGWQ